ncbi:MAG: hypothetical protein JWN67_3364 [Actinomycetia bacterium]|nr:hypothetical protein [Actinomycetes bacterium]
MEERLEAVLGRLEPLRETLTAWAQQGDLDLCLGFSSGNGQGGFGVDNAMLRRLSELPVDLTLDLYPPAES